MTYKSMAEMNKVQLEEKDLRIAELTKQLASAEAAKGRGGGNAMELMS